MKKSDLLLQRRQHRGDARGAVLNFLLNLSQYARFMREFLPMRPERNGVLQVAMKSYIIGMAACIETLFRDLYLSVLERDAGLIKKALSTNPRRDSDAAIQRYLDDGVPLPELAAAQVSFQNAESIDRNLSVFFIHSTFFEALGDFELLCAIPSVNRPGLARMKLFPDWQEHLARIFVLRHEFAHDGNSKTVIDLQEMRSLETAAILICQMAGFLEPLGSAGNSTDESTVPALFLIEDLIADDWEFVE
jgi:hypothetical protein